MYVENSFDKYKPYVKFVSNFRAGGNSGFLGQVRAYESGDIPNAFFHIYRRQANF